MYRSWGGAVAIDEIAAGLKELRSQGFMNMIKEIVKGYVRGAHASLWLNKKFE